MSVRGKGEGGEKVRVPYLLAERYELEGPPEEGIRRGWDRVTEREVTLRHLPVTNPEEHRRLSRDGKIFVRIHHPSVMQVLDVVAEEGEAPWITFNLVPETAPTLAEILSAEGRLPVRRATRIASDIAWGLSLLHRERLAYGDLEPARIHLSPDVDGREHARIAGLDRIRGRGEGIVWQGRELPGDPRYLAPEQLLGREATRASDLFALGSILYHMLAGRSPSAADTTEATVVAALELDAPEISPWRFGVPRSVRSVLRDLLRREPTERPELTAVLASRLEAAWERIRRLPWY